jgi:hypothetical protein
MKSTESDASLPGNGFRPDHMNDDDAAPRLPTVQAPTPVLVGFAALIACWWLAHGWYWPVALSAAAVARVGIRRVRRSMAWRNVGLRPARTTRTGSTVTATHATTCRWCFVPSRSGIRCANDCFVSGSSPRRARRAWPCRHRHRHRHRHQRRGRNSKRSRAATSRRQCARRLGDRWCTVIAIVGNQSVTRSRCCRCPYRLVDTWPSRQRTGLPGGYIPLRRNRIPKGDILRSASGKKFSI